MPPPRDGQVYAALHSDSQLDDFRSRIRRHEFAGAFAEPTEADDVA